MIDAPVRLLLAPMVLLTVLMVGVSLMRQLR